MSQIITRHGAKIWMYFIIIIGLHTQNTYGASDFPISSQIMNQLIAQYTAQPVCNAMQNICNIFNTSIATNSDQNIAELFPVGTNALNNAIIQNKNKRVFGEYLIRSGIIFGDADNFVNVTINNNTSGNNFVFPNASSPIEAQNDSTIHIFAGTTNPPFPSTGTITFLEDASLEGIVFDSDVQVYGNLWVQPSCKVTVNGNLYLYANLTLGNASTTLNVNGDLYFDSSLMDQFFAKNNGALNVSGTIYITGNHNLYLLYATWNINSNMVIESNAELIIRADSYSAGFAVSNGGTITIENNGTLRIIANANFNVNSGGIVTNNGLLTLNNTSICRINGGIINNNSAISLSTSIINVDNNGILNTNNGSVALGNSCTVNIKSTGTLNVQNSTLTINNGGGLGIEGNGVCNIQNSVTMVIRGILNINALGDFNIMGVGKIALIVAGVSTTVANESSNNLTYTLIGSTSTGLNLYDNNNQLVPGANPISAPPVTIQVGPYQAP